MPGPNESMESPDPRAELRRISVVVYDGNRVGLDKPEDMTVTEAVALLANATNHLATIQFHALQNATPGTKLVRPVQRVVGVRGGNGRRR